MQEIQFTWTAIGCCGGTEGGNFVCTLVSPRPRSGGSRERRPGTAHMTDRRPRSVAEWRIKAAIHEATSLSGTCFCCFSLFPLFFFLLPFCPHRSPGVPAAKSSRLTLTAFSTSLLPIPVSFFFLEQNGGKNKTGSSRPSKHS